jgi:hypothetical protein
MEPLDNQITEAIKIPLWKQYHISPSQKTVSGIPLGVSWKVDSPNLEKAVRLGLVILLKYRGEFQKAPMERTIIITSTSEDMIKGIHITGWSASKGASTTGQWRQFKKSRIISMSLTGGIIQFEKSDNSYQINQELQKKLIDSLEKSGSAYDIKTNWIKANDSTPVIEIMDTFKEIKFKEPFISGILPSSKEWVVSYWAQKDTKNIVQTIAILNISGERSALIQIKEGIINKGIWELLGYDTPETILKRGKVIDKESIHLYRALLSTVN